VQEQATRKGRGTGHERKGNRPPKKEGEQAMKERRGTGHERRKGNRP